MGSRLISFKGDSNAWRGQSTLSVSDRGQRRFLKLRNCYVSSDGSEIRSFPGFYGLWDNNEAANPNGWAGRVTTDILRPIYRTSPNEVYQYGYNATSPLDTRVQTLEARAKPVHYHGFEQVGDTIVVWGESRFREVPIYSAARATLGVTSIDNSTGTWRITLTGTAGSNTVSNVTGAGLNGLSLSNRYVYAEGWTVANPASQAIVDAELNGKVHAIASFAGGPTVLVLTSLSSTTGITTALTTTGSIGLVRPNRSGSYPTAAGTQNSPYTTVLVDRPDDFDALTSWRILTPLGGDTRKVCHPAWVANRRRDCGDKIAASGLTEGVPYGVSPYTGTWASRREQRELPYRTNSDCATDRIVLAAPAYGCMFQIPLKVPTNPTAWATDQTDRDLGIPLQGNNVYDAPRALGIPKARMVVGRDGSVAQSSPGVVTDYNFLSRLIAGSAPANGATSGIWKIAISYEDDALGEEGLASEQGEVTIPSGPTGYALAVNYIHPGYIMPECLALKLNVYLAPPGQDALAFYASFPLSAIPRVGDTLTANNTNVNTSGHYGFQVAVSPASSAAIMRSINLPLLGSGVSPATLLDPERLAPQSASMPRGADACRYLRGVLLAGGNLGNVGGNQQLWYGVASSRYDPPNSYDRTDEYQIRTYGGTFNGNSSGQDGLYGDSHFGMGGRCFPDAYQGSEVVSRSLFPDGGFYQRVDRIGNRRTNSLTNSASSQHLQTERVGITRGIYGRTRSPGVAPSVPTVLSEQQPLYYVEPKGQLQVGDPGAPWRSSKAAIQFIDPNRGDDVTAIGNVSGTAIICTKRETYSFAWYRNAGGEIPNLISNEHGCIAANSMVEFDGGCAWLGERGPVAMGSSLQFVGVDVQEDFYGPSRRYAYDSKGMMRHAWSCHDPSRGLVMWGLVTIGSEHLLSFRGQPAALYDSLSDEGKSRFACDEVLIWSYRTGSFSTWRPPVGLEVYWMRQIRLDSGSTTVAFLAADGRIYGLDDSYGHTAVDPQDYAVSADNDTATQTIDYTNGTVDTSNPGLGGIAKRFRDGMRIELFREGRLISASTIIVVGTPTLTQAVVSVPNLAARKKGDVLRIGVREPMEIVTTYMGAETMDNLNVNSLQMRYTLLGGDTGGDGHAKFSLLGSDFDDHRAVSMGPWEQLGMLDGVPTSGDQGDLARFGARKTFRRGGIDRPECAIKMEFTGKSQIRIADFGVEVG